jgi:hypothetical protein
VTAVVNKPGEKLWSATSQLLLGLLGRLVFPRPARRRCLHVRGRRRVARGCEGTPGAHGLRVKRRGGVLLVARKVLPEDVANGRQAVACLVGRHMMDVRSAGEVRRVRNVSRHGGILLAPGEAVAKRGRLDDALVGELLVRRSDNRQTGRLPARHAGRLGRELGHAIFVLFRGPVALGRLLL